MLNVSICVGSACHMKGSREVIAKLKDLVKMHQLEGKVLLNGSFCTPGDLRTRTKRYLFLFFLRSTRCISRGSDSVCTVCQFWPSSESSTSRGVCKERALLSFPASTTTTPFTAAGLGSITIAHGVFSLSVLNAFPVHGRPSSAWAYAPGVSPWGDDEVLSNPSAEISSASKSCNV